MRQVNQRLSVVGRQRITATLTGYAYETIPGKAIIAGATKGPDDGEPSASFTTPTSRTRHARRTGNGSTWTVDLARKESADIELVAQGLKNSEIAQAIGTTEFVVKSRIRAIYDKLGLWNRVEIALWYEARKHREETMN